MDEGQRSGLGICRDFGVWPPWSYEWVVVVVRLSFPYAVNSWVDGGPGDNPAGRRVGAWSIKSGQSLPVAIISRCRGGRKFA